METRVRIEAVQVVGRHRRDLGDLSGLMASIADVGLLHAVVLTPDMRLLAGARRLDACRRLGWDMVDARIVESRDDAAALLRAERDENVERKEMLPSELASLGEALYALAAAEAKERQRASGPASVTKREGRDDGSTLESGTVERSAMETSAVVGEALGMSRSTYAELRHVFKAAADPGAPEPERALARAALDRIDQGAGIQPTAQEFRRQVRDARAAQPGSKPAPEARPPREAPTEVDDDPDWVPAKGDHSQRAALRRRQLIRELANKGWTSQQIGQHINTADQTVRSIARDLDITIHADVALGTRTRRTLDSNRIVRETVTTLDGLVTGVGLVKVADLDPAQMQEWVASLTASIKVLNHLIKQMRKATP